MTTNNVDYDKNLDDEQDATALRAWAKSVQKAAKEDRKWRQEREAEYRSSNITKALADLKVAHVKAVARNFPEDVDPLDADAVSSWIEAENEKFDGYISFTDNGAGNQGGAGNGQDGSAPSGNQSEQRQQAKSRQQFAQGGKPTNQDGDIRARLANANSEEEINAILTESD